MTTGISTEVVVRCAVPADALGVHRLVGRCSRETRYRRFHGHMSEVPLDYLSRVGVPVESYVQSGDPATHIALLARDQNAAAVVMSTHGRAGLARTVLGSVAGQVVHRSPCPVLLVRPFDPNAADDAFSSRSAGGSMASRLVTERNRVARDCNGTGG